MSIIVLHERDNVGVAKKTLTKGTALAGGISVRGDIPAMHKVAIADISQGEKVRKFSQVIGSLGWQPV